jgi:hypothetical protein
MMTPVFVLIQSLAVCAPLSTTLGHGETPAVYALSEFGCDYPRFDTISTSAAAGASERAQLQNAQQHAPQLAALRAGEGPSNEQWGWIAIGGLVVLLIILL